MIYVIGAALIAVILAFFKGRLDGSKLERAKAAEAEREARDIADQVQNDVGALPPEELRKEAKKWGRG